MLHSVRGLADGARRVAGICTGSFVLAQAGVLDNRRVTTHWAFAPALRRMHPSVNVEDDRIFLPAGDGRIALILDVPSMLKRYAARRI